MARRARVVLPDIPHHISQRGVRRSPVFLDDEDRSRYYTLIQKNASDFGISILAYCWMTNHIHIVAIPERDDSFARAFRNAHSVYAREFNLKHGFSGYLWQERFYSCPLDADHARAAIRYVERNPVRAEMVGRAEDYPWSSAKSHCGLTVDSLVETNPLLDGIEDWASWLSEPGDPGTEAMIRKGTLTGRPCGTDAFVRDLESRTGLALMPRRAGRRRT